MGDLLEGDRRVHGARNKYAHQGGKEGRVFGKEDRRQGRVCDGEKGRNWMPGGRLEMLLATMKPELRVLCMEPFGMGNKRLSPVRFPPWRTSIGVII